MTEQFSPPTDNLYKFTALSGCALVLVCVYLAVQVVISVNTRSDRLLTEFVDLKAEEATVGTLPDSSPDLAFKTASHQVKVESWNVQLKIARERQNLSRLALVLLGGGIASGLLVACWGFYRWYDRVQRLEDECLAAETRIKLAHAARESELLNSANGKNTTLEP